MIQTAARKEAVEKFRLAVKAAKAEHAPDDAETVGRVLTGLANCYLACNQAYSALKTASEAVGQYFFI